MEAPVKMASPVLQVVRESLVVQAVLAFPGLRDSPEIAEHLASLADRAKWVLQVAQVSAVHQDFLAALERPERLEALELQDYLALMDDQEARELKGPRVYRDFLAALVAMVDPVDRVVRELKVALDSLERQGEMVHQEYLAAKEKLVNLEAQEIQDRPVVMEVLVERDFLEESVRRDSLADRVLTVLMVRRDLKANLEALALTEDQDSQAQLAPQEPQALRASLVALDSQEDRDCQVRMDLQDPRERAVYLASHLAMDYRVQLEQRVSVVTMDSLADPVVLAARVVLDLRVSLAGLVSPVRLDFQELLAGKAR